MTTQNKDEPEAPPVAQPSQDEYKERDDEVGDKLALATDVSKDSKEAKGGDEQTSPREAPSSMHADADPAPGMEPTHQTGTTVPTSPVEKAKMETKNSNKLFRSLSPKGRLRSLSPVRPRLAPAVAPFVAGQDGKGIARGIATEMVDKPEATSNKMSEKEGHRATGSGESRPGAYSSTVSSSDNERQREEGRKNDDAPRRPRLAPAVAPFVAGQDGKGIARGIATDMGVKPEACKRTTDSLSAVKAMSMAGPVITNGAVVSPPTEAYNYDEREARVQTKIASRKEWRQEHGSNMRSENRSNVLAHTAHPAMDCEEMEDKEYASGAFHVQDAGGSVGKKDDAKKVMAAGDIENNLIEAQIVPNVESLEEKMQRLQDNLEEMKEVQRRTEDLRNEERDEVVVAVAESSDRTAEEASRRKNKCVVLAIVVGMAAIGAAVWLSQVADPPITDQPTDQPTLTPTGAPTTTAPTQAPTIALRSRVEAIFADYAPLDEETMTWLTETSTWEPSTGNPDSDYLWLERYALALLYFSTDGSSWNGSVNWLSSKPICKWYNNVETIDCSGRLTKLNLPGNGLKGSLPSVIFALTALTEVALYDNSLTGTIPESIGDMTNLSFLHLDENQITGTIPASIGNMSNLTDLSLRTNVLTGSIPESIGNMGNLTNLALSGNKQFTGSIPDSIGDMSNLENLDLWDINLTGSIPASIGNMSNLGDLRLAYNKLTGSIPSSIINLSNLKALYLLDNQLTGSIPALIGTMSSIAILWIDNNQFTGTFPSSIDGSSGRFLSLSFYNNQLTGTIPESIGTWSNVGQLRLENNQLTGTIPVLPSTTYHCNLQNNCFSNITNAFAAGCNASPSKDSCP